MVRRKITTKEFYHICDTLSRMSEEELCEAYWKLRRVEWDERLGGKPENFDKLPLTANKWYQKLFNVKSKSYYTDLYCCGIEGLIERDKLIEFYNVRIAKVTPEQIETARQNRAKEEARMERSKKVHDHLILWRYIR